MKKIRIVSSDVEINEYKFLCIDTLSLFYSFKSLGILHCLEFFRYLTEIDSDFIDTYHELEVYIAIKDYKNNVKQLTGLRDLEVLRELEMNEIKEEARIQLNKVLASLKFELKYRPLRNRHLTRSNRWILQRYLQGVFCPCLQNYLPNMSKKTAFAKCLIYRYRRCLLDSYARYILDFQTRYFLGV